MADVTNNTSDSSIDSGFTTLHPSVQSNINNNDIIFQESSGLLPMFCCYTSEKGEDNKVQLFTTTQELLFKCGNPNLAKYGQEMYNMANWLNSDGIVYGIRVLPDNAGFSHAFVNIQTRKESKQVVDYKQNLVTVDNVLLKPALAFSTASGKPTYPNPTTPTTISLTYFISFLSPINGIIISGTISRPVSFLTLIAA